MSSNPFSENLDRNAANHQPLTPLNFLERAAAVFPNHVAIIHGKPAHDLRAILRTRAPAGVCARCPRYRRRRHRHGDAAQHPLHAGGALRRADARRCPAFAQHAARCRHYRLPARSRRQQGRHLRPRVHARDARGAQRSPRSSRSSSISTTGSSRRRTRRSPTSTTKPSSQQAIPPSAGACRRMNGTPSPSTTPAARPAIPRASSTATAAPP